MALAFIPSSRESYHYDEAQWLVPCSYDNPDEVVNKQTTGNYTAKIYIGLTPDISARPIVRSEDTHIEAFFAVCCIHRIVGAELPQHVDGRSDNRNTVEPSTLAVQVTNVCERADVNGSEQSENSGKVGTKEKRSGFDARALIIVQILGK